MGGDNRPQKQLNLYVSLKRDETVTVKYIYEPIGLFWRMVKTAAG